MIGFIVDTVGVNGAIKTLVTEAANRFSTESLKD